MHVFSCSPCTSLCDVQVTLDDIAGNPVTGAVVNEANEQNIGSYSMNCLGSGGTYQMNWHTIRTIIQY